MNLVAIVLSWLLALVCLASAALDFTHNKEVVATLKRLGCPDGFERIAGGVKLLAAIGLIGSMILSHRSAAFSVVTAVCLAVYFALAVVMHLRVKDAAKELLAPAGLMVLSLALAIAA